MNTLVALTILIFMASCAAGVVIIYAHIVRSEIKKCSAERELGQSGK